jgi:TPR repeat protein
MALSGDGKVALALGEEFAEMNRKSEARYWYQISSENGNGIAMNNLANLLRESDCERANFWLAKALKSEELPDEIDRSINEEMPKYLEDCR